jgi:transposase-like protein
MPRTASLFGPREVAEALGISERTVRKWLRRYHAEGPGACRVPSPADRAGYASGVLPVTAENSCLALNRRSRGSGARCAPGGRRS